MKKTFYSLLVFAAVLASAAAVDAIVDSGGSASDASSYSKLKVCPSVYFPECVKDKNSSDCVDRMKDLARQYPGCGFESSDGDFVKGGTSNPGTVSNLKTFCTMEYNPVCGVDDRTYSNSCVAESAGTKTAHKGECGAKTVEGEAKNSGTATRKILPPEDLTKDFVQLNNLVIEKITRSDSNQAVIVARGDNYPCYSFGDKGEAFRSSIPCPMMEVKTDSGTPEKIKLYEIAVSADTMLFLRDRQKASISDFEVGDKINSYGYFQNGVFRAMVLRNLSKPEQKEFVQLNNLVIIEKSGNVVKAARSKDEPCYSFGKRGEDAKREVSCPTPIPLRAGEVSSGAAAQHPTIAKHPELYYPFVVTITEKTVFLLRNRERATLADFEIGDKINVYGLRSEKIVSEIEALVMRNLSKPAELPRRSEIRGKVIEVKSDGGFVVQTSDGRLITVEPMSLKDAEVTVSGLFDEANQKMTEVISVIKKLTTGYSFESRR